MTYPYWIITLNNFIPSYDLTENSGNTIWAYTDNKKLMKRFKNERNKSKFNITKFELDESEVTELSKHNPNKYLMDCDLPAKDLKGPEIKTSVNLVLSHLEYDTTLRTAQGVIYSEIWRFTECNPYILKDKYLEALKLLNYVNGFNMLNATMETPLSMSYSPASDDELSPDLLGTFLSLFGDTMIN